MESEMSLVIRDEATIAVIQDIARSSGDTPEEVVRRAVAAEVRRSLDIGKRRATIAELQREVASWPSTGLKADKAFFDDLGGGL